MDHNSMPSEASITSLNQFLKSLINKIDTVLESDESNYSIKPNDCIGANKLIPDVDIETAAYEEVEQEKCSTLSLDISRSGIWDVTDITDHLDNIADDVRKEFDHSKIKTFSEKLSSISKSSVNTDECFSNISSNFCDNLPDFSCPRPLQPYYILHGSPFHLFNTLKLDSATKYSHFFSKSKRSAAYYGNYPYSYGEISHPSQPFSDNEYLLKIISYVEVVLPGLKFNSALVHKYDSGESYIPHHSDDEDEIENDSKIITISFGETRFIEFRNTVNSSIRTQRLNHGDVFIMDKASQGVYTHSIPQDLKIPLGIRISITLRQISKPKDLVDTMYSALSSDISEHDTITDFLYDLNHEAEEPVNVRLTVDDPFISVSSKHPNTGNIDIQGCLPQPFHQPSSQMITADVPNPAQMAAIHPSASPQTLYISSSMFRHLDIKRLSTSEQQAVKLFYPGATASEMLNRLKSDQKFLKLNKPSITKIFLLTGSNNIDSIYYDRHGSSLQSTSVEIKSVINYLLKLFPSALLNVINILPRKIPGRQDIIKLVNKNTEDFCNKTHNLQYVDTVSNYMFSNSNGSRRSEFFNPHGRFGSDDVHLNAKGVARLAKHLKFLAHQS